MILSYNEIEAIALKATRGAGLSWGLAEEAAFAARWLAERGLDWAATVLARCRADVGEAMQVDAAGLCGEALCPLRLGAYFADAGLPDGALIIRDVAAPLLLLPFLVRASNRSLAVRFGTEPAFAVAGGVLYSLGSASGEATAAVTVTLAPLPDRAILLSVLERPLAVAPDPLKALAAFERCTYVPASAQSRLAGAGAGLSDND